MSRATTRAARAGRRSKRRERPLGAAVGLGILVTLAVGLLILIPQLLMPHSALHLLSQLARYESSATLRSSPLFQQWSDQIQEQETLFDTPLSLLCGGLALGRLAPRYASLRRVLGTGAAMAFGIVAVALAFSWIAAVIQQNGMNAAEGGRVSHVAADADLVLRQTGFALAWIAVCVIGTRIGLLWRDRKAKTPVLQESTPPADLRPVRR